MRASRELETTAKVKGSLDRASLTLALEEAFVLPIPDMRTDMDTIDDRVRQIISDELGVRAELIASNSTLEDLGANLLDRASLTLALEEAFVLPIPDHDGQQLRTVRQVVDYITQRAGAASA